MAEILGWTATVLFVACYIPQIARLKKDNNLSIWLLIISLVANIIALIYSILINQPPLLVKYALTIIVISISLYYFDSSKQPIESKSIDEGNKTSS